MLASDTLLGTEVEGGSLAQVLKDASDRTDCGEYESSWFGDVKGGAPFADFLAAAGLAP